MMATKSKLEQAVDSQTEHLDPVRREFVKSEFRAYKWNLGQIKALEKRINDENDPDGEKKLVGQRHQLVTENASLFGHIMRHLGDGPEEKSALDSFLSGDDE